MAFRLHEIAVRQAQRLADGDGQKRIVVEYLRSDGGDGKFYIEPYQVQDALFYERKIGRGRLNVTVVRPKEAK
jgi:hypothetical protein